MEPDLIQPNDDDIKEVVEVTAVFKQVSQELAAAGALPPDETTDPFVSFAQLRVFTAKVREIERKDRTVGENPAIQRFLAGMEGVGREEVQTKLDRGNDDERNSKLRKPLKYRVHVRLSRDTLRTLESVAVVEHRTVPGKYATASSWR